ncbi:hypothetical protein Ancab_015047 [Ancistrocladus abbreviatus]
MMSTLGFHCHHETEIRVSDNCRTLGAFDVKFMSSSEKLLERVLMADSPSSLMRSEGSATKIGGPNCLDDLESSFGKRKEDQMANLSNRACGPNSILDQSDVPPPSTEANKPKLEGIRPNVLQAPSVNPRQALNNKAQGELCIRSQHEAESLGDSLHDSYIMNMNCIILNNMNLVTIAEKWESGQQRGVSSDEISLKWWWQIACSGGGNPSFVLTEGLVGLLDRNALVGPLF